MSYTSDIFVKAAWHVQQDDLDGILTNTQIAYGRKGVLEFLQYCTTMFGYLDYPQTVTKQKVFGFLCYQAYQTQRRRGQKLKQEEGAPIVERIFNADNYMMVIAKYNTSNHNHEELVEKLDHDPVGWDTVNQYLCSILKILCHQRSQNVDNLTKEHIRSERVTQLLQVVQIRTKKIKKMRFDEKIDHALSPYTNVQNIEQIEDFLFSENCYKPSYHVAAFCFLMTHGGVLHSKSLFKCELLVLCDLIKYDEGIHACHIFIMQIITGKTNGQKTLCRQVMRHRNINMCPIGVLGFYLMAQFHSMAKLAHMQGLGDHFKAFCSLWPRDQCMFPFLDKAINTINSDPKPTAQAFFELLLTLQPMVLQDTTILLHQAALIDKVRVKVGVGSTTSMERSINVALLGICDRFHNLHSEVHNVSQDIWRIKASVTTFRQQQGVVNTQLHHFLQHMHSFQLPTSMPATEAEIETSALNHTPTTRKFLFFRLGGFNDIDFPGVLKTLKRVAPVNGESITTQLTRSISPDLSVILEEGDNLMKTKAKTLSTLHTHLQKTKSFQLPTTNQLTINSWPVPKASNILQAGVMISHSSLVPPADDESTSTFTRDDDDSMMLENYERFLSNEGHQLHELLNTRSWMKDDASATEMEDDELEKEMKMLSLAEQGVSQEISDLMRSFRDQTLIKEHQQLQTNESLPTSTINKVITERLEQRDNFVSEEQRTMTNEETRKVQSKRKGRAQISNIHEVKSNTRERDTRESVNQSEPSDKACFGVDDICNRDPPEEIIFIHEDGSDTDENSSYVTGEIVHHVTTSVAGVESSDESLEINSLTDEGIVNGPHLMGLHREDEDIRATQLADIELGRKKVLRKQTFVGDINHMNTNLTDNESAKELAETYSLNGYNCHSDSPHFEGHGEEDDPSVLSEWNTPLHKNSATRVREDDQNSLNENNPNASSIPESRRSIVKILSLPTLEHRGERSRDDVATIQQSKYGGSVCRESVPMLEDAIDETSLKSTEEKRSNSSLQLDLDIRISQEDTTTEQKLCQSQNDHFDFRRIFIALQIFLLLIGAFVLGKEGQSICRKLSNLYRQKIPTGDPICPWQVRAAKTIKARMLYKANGGNGHEQYDMIQGYEENMFHSMKEEDLFGEDNAVFPLLLLGQPTQEPMQEPTQQDPSTQGETLPGVSMTASPAKRTYRSHISDRVFANNNKKKSASQEKKCDVDSNSDSDSDSDSNSNSNSNSNSDSHSDLDFNKKPKANPKAKQDRHNFAKDDSDSHSSTNSVDWSVESE
eukprot:jgi/Psemu1/45057/gm1.45057_g